MVWARPLSFGDASTRRQAGQAEARRLRFRAARRAWSARLCCLNACCDASSALLFASSFSCGAAGRDQIRRLCQSASLEP